MSALTPTPALPPVESLAGAALAQAVAVEVMVWKVHPRNTAHWMRADVDDFGYRVMGWVCGNDAFRPDIDDATALRVVARLRELNWKLEFRTVRASEWEVVANKGSLVAEAHWQPSLAEGICRVALLAVRAQKGGGA